MAIAAGAVGVYLRGRPAAPSVAADEPVAAEPAAPPSPRTFTLAAPFSAKDSEAYGQAVAVAAQRITDVAALLPPPLLAASIDGAAHSSLIVVGTRERTVDSISRIPRHERWEIRIASGNTTDSYTRQLDHFKIEIGVIGDSDQVVYLSNLSAPLPTVRTDASAKETRLYLVWQRGSMREADEEVLARAKILCKDKVIVHFCPEAVEKKLVELEDAHAKEAGFKRIRKSVFGIEPSDVSVYRFYLIEQKSDGL